uniref:Uncharacterized protein n=1 Tax=Panstrongylus lignarius TaxID=156445 RepID=A0A224XV05_9HEMI
MRPLTLLKLHHPTTLILAKVISKHRTTTTILYIILACKICSTHLFQIPLCPKAAMIIVRIYLDISKGLQLLEVPTTMTIHMLYRTPLSTHRINHLHHPLVIQHSTNNPHNKALGFLCKAVIPNSFLLHQYLARTITLSNNSQYNLRLIMHTLNQYKAPKVTLSKLRCMPNRKFTLKHPHHNQSSLILIHCPELSHCSHILRSKVSLSSLLILIKTILKLRQRNQFIPKLCLQHNLFKPIRSHRICLRK